MVQEIVRNIIFKPKACSIIVFHRPFDQSDDARNFTRTEYVNPGQDYEDALFSLFLDFMEGIFDWDIQANNRIYDNYFYKAIMNAREIKKCWFSKIRMFDFLYESDFETQAYKIIFDSIIKVKTKNFEEKKEDIFQMLMGLFATLTAYKISFEKQLKKQGKLMVETLGDSIFEGYSICVHVERGIVSEAVLAPKENVSINGILTITPEVYFLGPDSKGFFNLFLLDYANTGFTRQLASYQVKKESIEKLEQVYREKLSHLKMIKPPYMDFKKD